MTKKDSIKAGIKENPKVVDFLKEAQKKGKKTIKRKPQTPTQRITGNGNIQVGGDYIRTEKHITKTKPEVKPGEEHITDEQAAKLKEIVDDIAKVEAIAKKRPKSYGAIWSMLNNYCNVPQYRLIKKNDYEKAVKFLIQWRGGLSATKTAMRHDPEWRDKRIKAIHTIRRKFDLERKYRNYIKKNFDAESTLELTDEQLDKAYRYV